MHSPFIHCRSSEKLREITNRDLLSNIWIFVYSMSLQQLVGVADGILNLKDNKQRTVAVFSVHDMQQVYAVGLLYLRRL